MPVSRRVALIAVAALILASGCGGDLSTLRAIGQPRGDGPAVLELANQSGSTISSAHVAKTADVDRARQAGATPGSPEDLELWGEDLLGRESLRKGSSVPLGEWPAGRYDALLVDPDGREQLVRGLKLRSGGRYVLEAGSAWRLAR